MPMCKNCALTDSFDYSYYENESEEFRRKGIELTPELW